MRRTPALIVGAGPAGCAAAIGLANADTPALMLERTRETGDALCGGFLSWRSLDRLAALGVDADALNRERVTVVRLFAGERTRTAALPQAGLAVSRHRLDTLLMERALAAGAAVERGAAVREIDEVDGAATARVGDGTVLAADTLFLASGKHDVRGVARPATASGADPALGLRVRLASSPALTRVVAGAVELHLFDRGYAGLALQEDGSANLCLAVRRSRVREAGGVAGLLAVLAREVPALGDRLAAAAASPGDADAVANVPYGWRARPGDPADPPGIVRLGDQAGVIPSLAGEGMGIALASGAAAAAAYRRGGAAAMPDWQRRFAAQLARPIGVASAVRAAAERPRTAALMTFAPASLIQIIARMTRIGP